MHMHTHPHTPTYIDKHLHTRLHLSCLYTACPIELRGLLIRCIRNNCTFPERAPSYVPLAIDTQIPMHTYTQTHTHKTHSWKLTHTYIHTPIQTYVHPVYTQKFARTQIYAHMHINTHAYTHKRTHLEVHTYIHTHTHHTYHTCRHSHKLKDG